MHADTHLAEACEAWELGSLACTVEVDNAPAERGVWIGEARVVARHDNRGHVHRPGLLHFRWQRARTHRRPVVAVRVAFFELSNINPRPSFAEPR